MTGGSSRIRGRREGKEGKWWHEDGVGRKLLSVTSTLTHRWDILHVTGGKVVSFPGTGGHNCWDHRKGG